MGGRGVYEVEEEMLELDRRLSTSWWRRLFQRERWRLWRLEFTYAPTTVKYVKQQRREYEESLLSPMRRSVRQIRATERGDV